MNKVIGKIISFLGNMVPTTNLILFHSFPDIADNTYAMCKYLHEQGVDQKFRFVWLIDDVKSIELYNIVLEKNGVKAQLVKRISVKGIWFFIRARYVFVSHGLFDSIVLKQHPDKIINLWHGMPLKLLGASEKRGIPSSSNFNYVISSSRLYQKIMAEAFATTIDKVLVTGQPRCDLLFESTDWFEVVGINRSVYRKIGIWLPTYRKSIIGDVRVDGEFIERCVSFLDETDLKRLDKFLHTENILLLLKIHPMDALQNSSFDDFENIVLIKPQGFHSQLYPLLGACDFMLTDYSSVFIDYQILRRPMGFVMNDINSYKNNRGFYFDDLEEALPGPILSDLDSICSFIKSPVYVGKSICFNDFYDNKASKRICDFLNIS